MADQDPLEEYVMWEDVIALKDERRASNSNFKTPKVGRPSTPTKLRASTYDRREVRPETDVSGLLRKENSEMAGTIKLGLKQTLLPFKNRGRSDSMDEEFSLFPSYLKGSDCNKDEALCIQKSTSESKLLALGTVDDTLLQHRPTMHVDYLSHDWLEEDIWASWKHLVSRRATYSNGLRLENASWRMWGKTRSNLGTIPPETIKWTKDNDVTWLYGPLQPGRSQSQSPDVVSVPARMVDSAISMEFPKPILKTPSLYQLLLQRSLSNKTISRESSPSIESSLSDQSTSPVPKQILQKANTFPLFSTPSRASSTTSDKSVRFHDEVVQCISLHTDDGFGLDQEDITCQNTVDVEFRSDKTRKLKTFRSNSARSDALRTIELLAPTQLKAETKPLDTNSRRANSWPSRTLLPLNENFLPSPSARIKDDDVIDWISPVHSKSARSQILDNYLNDSDTSNLTEEELFEIEMFGSNQRNTLGAKAPHSLFTPSNEGEELEIHSSPSMMSEYSSSGSDDLDDEDFTPITPQSPFEETSNFQPTSHPTQLKPQRLPVLQSPNDLKTTQDESISNLGYDSFNIKDRDSASPPYQPSRNFAVRQPTDSSQVSESMMDDEDHWWMMNV